MEPKEKYQSAVSVIDHLMALYSIHPAISVENTMQQIAKLINQVRLDRNRWNTKTNQYPVVQREIDRRMKQLGIKEDEMPKLMERYKQVRRIQ